MQQTSLFLLSTLRSLGMVTLLVGLLVGCDATSGIVPDDQPPPLSASDSTVIGSDIQVALRAPDTVTTGEAFELRTQLDNQSGKTVQVTTGSAALYDFGIYDEQEVVPVKGSLLYCATVVTDHNIAPGTTSRSIDLRAVQSSNEAPIAPGTYAARLTLNWEIGGTRVKDTLSTPIVFRDE